MSIPNQPLCAHRRGVGEKHRTRGVAERAQAAHEVLPPNLRPVRDQDAVRVVHASAEVEDDIGNEVHVHEELDPPVAVSDLSLHVKPHAQRHHDGHVQQEKGLAEVPDLAEPSFRVDEPDLFAVLLRGAADPDHGEIVALRQQRRLRRLSAHCTQRTASAAAYGERWQRAGTANGAGGSCVGLAAHGSVAPHPRSPPSWPPSRTPLSTGPASQAPCTAPPQASATRAARSSFSAPRRSSCGSFTSCAARHCQPSLLARTRSGGAERPAAARAGRPA